MMNPMSSSQPDAGGWRPRRRRMRSVLSFLIRVLFRALTRFEVEGRENLPGEGPLIVAANHFHFVDPVAVIRAMPWPLDFVGGFHMRFAPPWVRWIPRLWGLYRVRREGSSRGALRQAEAVLAAGGVLGIFPEGGSWTNVLRRPRPGTAFLATRTGARVLPVGLDGIDRIFSELRRGRRARVSVRIGPVIGPFPIAPEGRAGRESLDRVGDTVMKAIAALIPERSRGAYSDDPELRRAAESVAYPWERAGTATAAADRSAVQKKED
jgi:1-acyl-sn-glycerol-3-phosphate acyltransferase